MYVWHQSLKKHLSFWCQFDRTAASVNSRNAGCRLKSAEFAGHHRLRKSHKTGGFGKRLGFTDVEKKINRFRYKKGTRRRCRHGSLVRNMIIHIMHNF